SAFKTTRRRSPSADAASLARRAARLSSVEALSTTTTSYSTEGGDATTLSTERRSSSPAFQLTMMMDSSALKFLVEESASKIATETHRHRAKIQIPNLKFQILKFSVPLCLCG